MKQEEILPPFNQMKIKLTTHRIKSSPIETQFKREIAKIQSILRPLNEQRPGYSWWPIGIVMTSACARNSGSLPPKQHILRGVRGCMGCDAYILVGKLRRFIGSWEQLRRSGSIIKRGFCSMQRLMTMMWRSRRQVVVLNWDFTFNGIRLHIQNVHIHWHASYLNRQFIGGLADNVSILHVCNMSTDFWWWRYKNTEAKLIFSGFYRHPGVWFGWRF